jgi:alpha-D-ribose 1-methylphosphonate 5-triphosphate synthase subunit PhnL
MKAALTLDNVEKTFTMHLQGGTSLVVVKGVSLEVAPGECVALGGPSGIGKSSILKMIYANYRCEAGRILVMGLDGAIDAATAEPRQIIRMRRHVVGYVSQFLRVIPRVSALDIVAASARDAGEMPAAAKEIAADLLKRLNLPARLWSLPPATFSGGEQQRVNIARGFAGRHSILLLDEPTASLDTVNRDVVAGLIAEKKSAGVALLGIFHDPIVRDRVADRVIDVARFARRAA